MKLKKILSLGLATTMAVSLAACGGSSSGGNSGSGASAGGDVIKIGVFEPTTGENGGGGYQEVLGIRYANETHKTVKIGDKDYTIELVEVDNKSDKTEAVNAANKLMGEKVSVVLGSYGSGVSIAAGQIFADAKVPAIGCSCTNPQVTQGNEYYFRVCFLDPFQGTVMANYAMQNGYKSAAILTQLGDDYSSGLGSYFKTAFSELGGTVVDEEQFQTNQTDFKAVLTNIKAANPDVIFAPSSITTAPLIIKQARELGIESLIAAGDTWENSTIIDNAGADAEGVVLSTFFDEAEPANAEAESFIKGFKEYLKKNDQSDIIPAVSALGYDAYLAAYNAIEKAQSTDGEAIKEALKGVSYDGVTGAVSFNEEGDANKDMAFIKTIKDGGFQFLTTTTIDG
ncbi:ABC transporter substrate-binding protein [Oribacterium sp. WCC10]|uniref:ABC transporter substrate-binding protein n=1 Tax=Oribacterium sp. WCC10 TaxID=1855343 RepID=UPI0008E3A0CF|nr:ABC transporter substrate-binding protein [Oribacterium sp. WCC10]SFG31584.1 amino acid/amide ABC transporter substrate-binding protein, HAAT family [Oribacterium sp. WCC10]